MTLRWEIDPDDPRAPPSEVWEKLSPEERDRIVAALPTDMPWELHPPEGDEHRKPKERARDALDEFFRSTGRKVYVSSELVTFYPGEPRFCPDILAVMDVEPHDQQSWVVAKEGKGLDLVIEVHVGGDAKKDFERNVTLFARLGIAEYFIFDRPRGRIVGYRLPARGAAYERLVPQAGRFRSDVLGLDLCVDGGSVRFFHGSAQVLFREELVGRLNSMVTDLIANRDEAVKRAEEEARRAEEEARRAEEEARRAERRADDLAKRVAELEAEIARLTKR